jgi:hypothetical protein
MIAFLEIVIFAMLVLTLVSEVIIPLFKGLPLFPTFRSPALKQAEAEIREAVLAEEIRATKRRAEAIRNEADTTKESK